MAWVTYRQHRVQLLSALALLFALAMATLATHLPIASAYHRQALASCLPPSSRSGCDLIVKRFETEFANGVEVVRWLVVALPAFVGLFVGAPLLAREIEQGTYRFAWTQTVGRRRWLVSKTVIIGTAAVLGACVLSGLAMWWRHPFDSLDGQMAPHAFDVEGLVVPAYTLFALVLGTFAGLLLRRTLPAMSVTLAGFAVARLVVERFLRPHFLPAHHQTAVGLTSVTHARDWVLSSTLVDAAGRAISTGREDLAVLHAQQGGIDPHGYLVSLGWHRILLFQPSSRFWTFQAIEAGIFVLGAAALFAATLWLIRRTPA